MGEISEMILEGTLCQVCGGVMDDVTPETADTYEAPGYPRTCKACKQYEQENSDGQDQA